jgi:hypothetical protein
MPTISNNYSPNTCRSDGTYAYTPGPNGGSESSDNSAQCEAAVEKAVVSTVTCSLATAAAVGSGGLAAAGATLACYKAAVDGVAAMHACGH